MSSKLRKILSRIGLTAIVLFISAHVTAEKYFTWVDENGRVQHTLIKEEENPLITKESDTGQGGKAAPSSTGEQDSISVESRSDVLQPVVKTPPEVGDGQQESKAGSTKATTPVNDSPAEAHAPAKSKKTQSSSGKPEFDLTVVDEVDYVDGDELEQNNFVRPGEAQRYYTWRDAEGRMVNSPYDGKDAAAVSASRPQNVVAKKEVAKISTFDQIPSVKSASSDADANALKILGIKANAVEEKQAQISNFLGEACCLELDFEFITELPLDDEFLVEVNRTSKRHIFLSGKSAYELVLLPDADKDYLVRFKTFINDEAFLPTFVYLDEKFLPVRIVTNISTTYTPENWFRYAYLEGVVDAKVSTAGERYILIITTRKGVESKTFFVDEKAKDITISHGELGSLELFTIH